MSDITLDIGGIKYKTLKSTLLKYDSIFSGLLDTNPEEVFIDRNGTLFQYILDFFRSGRIHIEDKILCKQLIDECEYYCITNLKKILEKKLKPKILKYRKIIKGDLSKPGAIDKDLINYSRKGYQLYNTIPDSMTSYIELVKYETDKEEDK